MTERLQEQPEFAPQPVFNEFILKLNSRCILQPGLRKPELALLEETPGGCDYCYEYTDNTAWQDEPAQMSLEVATQTALRINEHTKAHGLDHVRVILHGGEPLSFHATYLDSILTTIRGGIDNAEVYFSVQTNGLPLDEEKLAVLAAHKVTVGLSLDGDKTANDRHRRSQRGKSVYDSVLKAAGLLEEADHPWGILSVIDTRNHPEYTLETHASRHPKSISFFPSHANHSSTPRPSSPEHLPLGAWERRLTERYITWHLYHLDANGEPGPAPDFTLPIPDAHMMQFLAGKSMHERAGNRYTQEIYITSSGKWQRLDTLKSTENGAVFTGMNVFDHSLDRLAEQDPGIIARRMASTLGMHAMAEICETCPLFGPCGGDYYPLRYRQPAEPLTPQSSPEAYIAAFRNPSVDCEHQKHSLGYMATMLEQDGNMPAGTLTGGQRLPITEMDAILEQSGISMLIGNYVQIALNEKLRRIEETCPSIALSDSPDALIRILRLLNRQAIFAPDGEGADDPIIPEELYEPLCRYIRHPAYGGRLGLYALAALYRQDFLSRITAKLAYWGSAHSLDQQSPVAFDEAGPIVGSFKDVDDAIIQALFDSQQSIPGWKFKPPIRYGDLYVASSHSMRALYNARDAIEGSVHPVALQQSEGESSVSNLGFTYYHSPRSANPVTVRLEDMPENMLILEIPGATQAETELLMDEIRDLVQEHPRPYDINEILKRRPSPAYLLPLSGFWTPRTNVNWRIPSKHESPRQRSRLTFERQVNMRLKHGLLSAPVVA